MGKKSKSYGLLLILMLATSSSTLLLVRSVNAQFSPPSVVWQKTYGNSDQIPKVFQTSDGGYLFLGLGWSHQMGREPTALYKLDSQGNLTWSQEIRAPDLVQTYDGGYVVLQSTYASFSLAKYDEDSNLEWNQTNPSSQVYFRYLTKTMDDGYVTAGNNDTGASSYMFYGITQGIQPASSIIKTDYSGKIEWIRNFNINGTSNVLSFEVSALTATIDGGISLGGTATMNSQDRNYCLVKISSQGSLEWVKTYGGEKDDIFNSLIQTSDGGYVLAGNSFSYNGVPNYVSVPKDDPNLRVEVRSTGGPQAWLVKTDSSGKIVWNYVYGSSNPSGLESESYWTTATFVSQTSDGGLVFVGAYRSIEAMWLVKTAIDGSLQWDKTFKQVYGQSGATSVLESSDGSLLVAGYTQTMPDSWNSEYLLVKTSSVLPSPTPTPTPILTPAPTTIPNSNISFDVLLTVIGIIFAIFAILAISLLLYKRFRKKS